jgi:hypothetical protein
MGWAVFCSCNFDFSTVNHVAGTGLRPPILPGSCAGVTFSRVRERARKLTCAWIAACFAYTAITWGSMPGCIGQPDIPAVHASHGHDAPGTHSHAKGGLPASNQCAVHLCCIQLTGAPGEAGSSGRLTPAEQGAGPAATGFVLLRPSYTLPFAHGPPLSPA